MGTTGKRLRVEILHFILSKSSHKRGQNRRRWCLLLISELKKHKPNNENIWYDYKRSSREGVESTRGLSADLRNDVKNVVVYKSGINYMVLYINWTGFTNDGWLSSSLRQVNRRIYNIKIWLKLERKTREDYSGFRSEVRN